MKSSENNEISSIQRKIKISLLATVAAGLFFAVSFVKLPGLDQQADSYFSQAITAAALTYATTRAVNAVVSVVKESHLEMAPAGVGVSIAAGQILDPIDDMTERLSTMLVTAIASIGIQKVGYEIGIAISFKAIAIIILFCIPLLWLRNINIVPALQLAIRLSLILLLLRFMLPTAALISDSIYNHWLKPGVEISLKKLSVVSENYSELRYIHPEQDKGFFASLTEGASKRVEQTRKAFSNMVDNAENIIASLLTLMTAYLTIFIVEVLLLPLSMLWLLVALFKGKPMDQFSGLIVNKLYSGALDDPGDPGVRS